MEKRRLPTVAELFINETALGQCNHPEHTTETVREGRDALEYLLCTKCGQRFDDDDYEYRWEGKKRPPDYLERFVPRHCEDIIMARALIRRLEGQGWMQTFRAVNGKYQCSFRKGDVILAGSFEPSEEQAICTAAVELGKVIDASRQAG
jgi:hypothetical protein